MSSWVNMLVISIYDLSCDAGINVSPSLTFRAGKRLNLHGSPLRSSLSFSYIFLIICNVHHICLEQHGRGMQNGICQELFLQLCLIVLQMFSSFP